MAQETSSEWAARVVRQYSPETVAYAMGIDLQAIQAASTTGKVLPEEYAELARSLGNIEFSEWWSTVAQDELGDMETYDLREFGGGAGTVVAELASRSSGKATLSHDMAELLRDAQAIGISIADWWDAVGDDLGSVEKYDLREFLPAEQLELQVAKIRRQQAERA